MKVTDKCYDTQKYTVCKCIGIILVSTHDNYNNTVVSEIFAGHNFREFCEEGWIHENSLAKIIVGVYKIAAVYTLIVRAMWEQRAIAFVYACSKGIFSIPGLLKAAKNLSNATAPNSVINTISSNTALILKHGHLQKRVILHFFLRKIKCQKLVSTINDSTLCSVANNNT